MNRRRQETVGAPGAGTKAGAVGRFAVSATGRLAASYLAIIMVMSLGFSLVLYNTSAHELQRQAAPHMFDDRPLRPDDSSNGSGTSGSSGGGTDDASSIGEYLRQRADEARRALIQRLLILNLLTLLGGAGLSYYLARRTLRPIEENMEAQSQFVSDASHELRTPLTTLQTSNEVALRNHKLSLPQSRALLQQNVEEVAKLQALTDALLNLALPDGGKLQLRDVSLQDIAADAMNRVITVAQIKDMTIDDRVPAIMVRADRQSLSQALVILLDNAIKYSPAGSTVRLGGGKRGRQAMVQVRDQGPGIRPYDLRRIFDRFYRADQSRTSQQVVGHGIGLSLAKKIVVQHGGDIKVSSTVGKGSVFTIVLPAG